MFLGVIIFFILAVSAGVFILRGLHTLMSDPGRNARVKEPRRKAGTEGEKSTGKKGEGKKEAQEESPLEEVPEETRRRYTASLDEGITEEFCTDETSFRIDGKALADECVLASSLSYLEYDNRALAGKEFHGFNLIVEDGSRMVLTYDGSAVASLTKTEKETAAIINGKTVIGTMPSWRTNTFPPEVKEGTVVSDVEKMLAAAESVKACAGDPARVSRTMVGLFTEGTNVCKLKGSIDRKIQSKESVHKGKVLSHGSPRRLSPR